MKQKLLYPLGIALAVASLFAGLTHAQTIAPGPYYAQPSWDQKLPCDTQAACPRFIVLANWDSAAVLDRETGLVWERSPSNSQLTWILANRHCQRLDLGHRVGWRLPTISELGSLIDTSDTTPPFPDLALPPGHPFQTLVGDKHWSATSTGIGETALSILMQSGDLVPNFAKTTLAGVMCVRGGSGPDIQ